MQLFLCDSSWKDDDEAVNNWFARFAVLHFWKSRQRQRRKLLTAINSNILVAVVVVIVSRILRFPFVNLFCRLSRALIRNSVFALAFITNKTRDCLLPMCISRKTSKIASKMNCVLYLHSHFVRFGRCRSCRPTVYVRMLFIRRKHHQYIIALTCHLLDLAWPLSIFFSCRSRAHQ